MQADEKLSSQVASEDALVVIGDIALSGQRLQVVAESGLASCRIARVCAALFTEIAELAGAADPATSGNDA